MNLETVLSLFNLHEEHGTQMHHKHCTIKCFFVTNVQPKSMSWF